MRTEGRSQVRTGVLDVPLFQIPQTDSCPGTELRAINPDSSEVARKGQCSAPNTFDRNSERKKGELWEQGKANESK